MIVTPEIILQCLSIFMLPYVPALSSALQLPPRGAEPISRMSAIAARLAFKKLVPIDTPILLLVDYVERSNVRNTHSKGLHIKALCTIFAKQSYQTKDFPTGTGQNHCSHTTNTSH